MACEDSSVERLGEGSLNGTVRLRRRQGVFPTCMLRRRSETRSFGARYFLRDLRTPRLRGTLPPASRASLRPMAMACFRLVTLLPERPDCSVPLFRFRIARATFRPAVFPYFAIKTPPGPSACKANAPDFTRAATCFFHQQSDAVHF